MFDIIIKTRMKRKYRTDASWSLCNQKLKVKLTLMQPKFYFVAREWRSGHLAHGSTCHPCGERDLTLKSKDNVVVVVGSFSAVAAACECRCHNNAG